MASYLNDIKQTGWDIWAVRVWRSPIIGRGTSLLGIISTPML